MCLVSYIPVQDGEFVLCSNRDESPHRATHRIIRETIHHSRIAYPGDMAGGSWVFMSHNQDVLCILNGAFQNHKHSPPYKVSRGLMAKAFFEYKDAKDFLRYYDFNGIEPFTLVIKTKQKFLEVRWDESVLHIDPLDISKSYVWSSCTLYTPEEQNEREEWYRALLPGRTLDIDNIMDLHSTHKDNNHHGFIMNREDRVATISITALHISESQSKMVHHDLVADKKEHILFKN